MRTISTAAGSATRSSHSGCATRFFMLALPFPLQIVDPLVIEPLKVRTRLGLTGPPAAVLPILLAFVVGAPVPSPIRNRRVDATGDHLAPRIDWKLPPATTKQSREPLPQARWQIRGPIPQAI